MSSDTDSFEFQVSEHLRLSGVYWGACALHLLGELQSLDAAQVVSFVRSCQRGCGGFGGNLGHDAHMLYTLSAVQVLALFGALHTVDAGQTALYAMRTIHNAEYDLVVAAADSAAMHNSTRRLRR